MEGDAAGSVWVQKMAILGHPACTAAKVVCLCACVMLAAAQTAGTGSEVLPAEFRWAQRKDRILLTIELQGVHDERFEITSEGVFRFEGTGSYRDQRDHVGRYSVDLKLLKGLNASDAACEGLCANWRLRPREKTCSTPKDAPIWETCVLASEVYNVTHCEVNARDVSCVLIKAAREPYWPHLLLGAERPKTMKVDWAKWLDEEKDGTRWNSDVDRPWEWWKHDDEEEDEETEEERVARDKLKAKFKKHKRKRKRT